MTDAFARSSDPDTAHDAADRVRQTKLEQQVYEALLKHPGVFLTSIEVAQLMGVDKWSISPRFQPLKRKGLVEQSEKIGLNSSGKPRTMQAWRAVKPKPVQLHFFEGAQ